MANFGDYVCGKYDRIALLRISGHAAGYFDHIANREQRPRLLFDRLRRSVTSHQNAKHLRNLAKIDIGDQVDDLVVKYLLFCSSLLAVGKDKVSFVAKACDCGLKGLLFRVEALDKPRKASKHLLRLFDD
jgi:hypothetical protein